MHYYQVWLSSQKYHGSEPLTYSSAQPLAPGVVVRVPLRNYQVDAIVTKKVNKPNFAAKAVTKVLVERPLPKHVLTFMHWLKEYYPAPIGTIASLFLPAGLLSSRPNEATALEAEATVLNLPPLKSEQSRAIAKIKKTPTQTIILHGDTGTGKTRVYIELIKEKLKDGFSCLVLTPEIGLTSPLSKTLQESLNCPIIVLHSKLSVKQHRELWLKILHATKPVVVVGPRSALFAPLERLGLIVIDEAHDNAYKQDQSPYYQTVRAAGALSSVHCAQLILGSATPSIVDYFIANQKQAPIVRMTQQATSPGETKIQIVNIKDRDQFSRHSHLSDVLIKSISEALDRGEQSLVFLNRRGTARLVMCQNCEWEALCPNCDLPLTYHGDSHLLRCHTCGFKQSPPTFCPVCSSTEITFRSIGTKSLADSLSRLFPEAIVRRFDTDNSRQESLEKLHDEVKSGKVNILVGTQMLVKGHDLPKLGVVGVVAADSSLYFPDYTAEEQTYQLLSQVIGRVGRGHRKGKAIIQTYQPNSPTLQTAINRNWEEFYRAQLEQRQQFDFPPFCFVLKLICSRRKRETAIEASEKLAHSIRSSNLKAEILGPAPCFIEKKNNNFSWQLIVKAPRRSTLLEVIKILPPKWSYNLDPTNLL